MRPEEIDDRGLAPDDTANAAGRATLEQVDPSLCPECQGVGTTAAGETCPVCDGTGRAGGRTGGG